VSAGSSVAGIAVVLVLLTGCSTDVSGTARPLQPAAPRTNLPTRTKDVSLRDTEPCRLLTPGQLDELKENGAPRAIAQDNRRDGPTCAFDVDATPPTYTYYLETITAADLEDWISGSHRKAGMIQQPVDVPGYPAVVRHAPDAGGVLDCETLVGVADGQTLRAEVAPDDRSMDQEQLCAMSTNLAKMALRTLGATP
jgi:hypothetical protein